MILPLVVKLNSHALSRHYQTLYVVCTRICRPEKVLTPSSCPDLLKSLQHNDL